MKNEIILYRPDGLANASQSEVMHIEVRFDEDTVWLTLDQIAELFLRDKSTVSRHIRNIYIEGELDRMATVANYATVQTEGGRRVERIIEHYNLDVIISVGYRVKSVQGTHFRRWATSKLKDYLLKGYAINNRMNRIENNADILKNRVDELELQINTNHIPTQGIFFDGQMFDAYELVSRIIRSAKQNIILIDNYIDETTLIHLTKKNKDVMALLLTQSINKQLNLDVQKVNSQYGGFIVKEFNKSHDRFLIIDNGKEIYHIGASLKDLGKKWFAFSKLDKESVASLLTAVSELM